MADGNYLAPNQKLVAEEVRRLSDQLLVLLEGCALMHGPAEHWWMHAIDNVQSMQSNARRAVERMI